MCIILLCCDSLPKALTWEAVERAAVCVSLAVPRVVTPLLDACVKLRRIDRAFSQSWEMGLSFHCLFKGPHRYNYVLAFANGLGACTDVTRTAVSDQTHCTYTFKQSSGVCESPLLITENSGAQEPGLFGA